MYLLFTAKMALPMAARSGEEGLDRLDAETVGSNPS
jgi:hypothetical protein